MIKTSPSNAGDVGSVSDQGVKIPHASEPKHHDINNISNIVTNSIKTLAKVHIKKKSLKEVLMVKSHQIQQFSVTDGVIGKEQGSTENVNHQQGKGSPVLKYLKGTCLVVQRLRFLAPNVGSLSLIPGQELDPSCCNED